VSVPPIGEGYRGSGGHSGYLLRQAWQAFRAAMETALRPHGLTAPQFALMSVLARDPGASGADLARATATTAQATNGVLATLEREGLVERTSHPTHGRIRQVVLTGEGQRRLAAAVPAVRALEREIERGLSAGRVADVKAWLVTVAQRLG
jgi:DNA-binding MarR family transcriptional regulator